MINKIYILSVIVFAIFIESCNKTHSKKIYYENGNIKENIEYYKNQIKSKYKYDSIGNLSKALYYSNEQLDSLIIYNKNKIRKYKKIFNEDVVYQETYSSQGFLERKGEVFNDSLSINWWNFYDKNGQLKAKRHYIVTCGKSILNQSIILNKKGDTVFRNDDYNESTFYDFKVTKLHNSKLKVDYKIIPVSNRSKLRMFYINKDNFCDLETKDFDTIIDLNARTGTCILNANISNKGIIADYRTLFTEKELKEKGISKNRYLTREMYFDLDDYVVKNMNK